MKKILAVSILLASCSTVKKVEVPRTENLPEIPVETPAPIGEFTTSSNLTWLQDVVRVANCVKRKEELYKEIEETEFTMNNGKTSKQIAQELRAGSFALETFSKWTLWNSKQIATYDTAKNAVLFRIQKNPRSMEEMIETAFHEPMHLLKYYHNGNYNTAENRKTVPYKVGEIARKHIGECK